MRDQLKKLEELQKFDAQLQELNGLLSDYDPASECFYPPVDLDDPQCGNQNRKPTMSTARRL